MIKVCKTCGSEYDGHNASKYCDDECNPRNMKNKIPTFIAIDGEGVTRPDTKEHIYDMLSCGDRTLLSDGSQLQWHEVFEFLWDCYEVDKVKHTNPIYIGFFLNYDFIQWTRTLPLKKAQDLWTPQGKKRRRKGKRIYMVDLKAPDKTVWEFDILGTKQFSLRKKGERGIMYINDTGPFFQTAFVNVLFTKDPITKKSLLDTEIVSEQEYKIIEDGKAARGNTATLEQQMETREITKQYNLLENEILARVITRLDKGMREADIYLKNNQWYGPGQASQQWMRNIGIPETSELDKILPEYAREAAQASYYGGWFEIFNHGHVPGTVYEYDINSAYPAEIADLPCLQCGYWEELGKKDNPHPGSLTICYVEVEGGNPDMGPLPFRTPQGRILRPLNVEGWYWLHEIEAADRAGLINTVKYIERISYVPAQHCRHERPFAEITTLYQKRLDVGKESPAGKAYKLIYNSAYGKTAQSIGSPKFASPIYASLITAGCRVRILDCIATHPVGVDDVVMVATDGIYFRSPHDNLDIDKERLGAWDVTEKHNLTLLMPGVYWDDKSRENIKKGLAISVKSRGISAKALSLELENLDRLFDDILIDGLDDTTLDRKFPIKSSFDMISCTQALAQGKWELAGSLRTYDDNGVETVGSVREVSINPELKRDVDNLWMDRGSIRSTAYEYFMDNNGEIITVSKPYDKEFGHVGEDGTALDFITPDYIDNPFGG